MEIQIDSSVNEVIVARVKPKAEAIAPTKTMTLDLNEKTLSLSSGALLRSNATDVIFTVKGNGGKIVKNIESTSVNERILFAYAGAIKSLGGEYIVDIQNATVTSTAMFQCRSGATLDLNGCSITQLIHGSTVSGNKSGLIVYGAANSKLNIENCTIFGDA